MEVIYMIAEMNKVQRFIFSHSLNAMVTSKKRRQEACSNEQRAKWALAQGVSEFIFYLCA